MRVCVCVDGTSISENAFDYYHRNLSDESNEYVFVHCVKQPDLGFGNRGPGALAGVLKKLQAAEDEARNAQESFESHIRVNCPVNINVIDFIITPATDKMGQSIIDTAVENNCNMIVSGTRGLDENKDGFSSKENFELWLEDSFSLEFVTSISDRVNHD